MPEDDDPRPEPERDESELEKLDRNTIELLNELRVAGTGIQIMFAFLLAVPFNNGWKHTTSFERTVYFITLLLVAVAAFLLMAPPIHHRILFRHREKRYIITVANRLAIVAMVFLAFGFTGILILLADVVVGGVAPVLCGVLGLAVIAGLWFAVPLARRAREREPRDERIPQD